MKQPLFRLMDPPIKSVSRSLDAGQTRSSRLPVSSIEALFPCDIVPNQSVMARAQMDATQQWEVTPQSEMTRLLEAMLSSEVTLSPCRMRKTIESEQTALSAKAVTIETDASGMSHLTRRPAQWH
jgi:hypothetical protein